jgi:hypothetical protein
MGDAEGSPDTGPAGSSTVMPGYCWTTAESDPYAAEFEEYFLKTEGFEVEVTLSEAAARETFATVRPAVVIVELAVVPFGRREQRFLHVRKLRGSGFLSGQHSYRLTPRACACSPADRHPHRRRLPARG